MNTNPTTGRFSIPLLAVAALLAGCTTHSSVAPGWQPRPDGPGSTLMPRTNSVPVSRQDIVVPSRHQVHPPTSVSAGLAIGNQKNETNTGDPNVGVLTSSSSAVRLRARGEHFFESGFGGLLELNVGLASDLTLNDGVTGDGDQDRFGLFLAAGFRATPNESFRLPVRFGPYLEQTKLDYSANAATAAPGGTVERRTFGFQLAAEPEFIVMQSAGSDGRITELSVFSEVAAGAGPTDSKVAGFAEQEGYAFNFSYELGVRYRFPSGLVAGLSYYGRKYHVATTESYNGTPASVLFGVDDDFNGIMLTGAWRF